MDKKNLVFILVVNLVVIFFAFSVIYNRYEKYKTLQTLEIVTSKTSEKKLEPVSQTSDTAKENAQETKQEPEQQGKYTEKFIDRKIEKKNQGSGSELRHILFQYKSSKAKSVQIIGDFNNWAPERLSKTKKNTYELSKKLRQGSYAYNYLIDGKVILDPNNRKPPIQNDRGYKSSYLELKPVNK
ncbi:MAG: glycogen-binding domain-containing protein [Elusimicrobia bacterium]|nr:glycogen-binding domain-containing protein [Elusimicrobiota bacterium]MBU2614967.1 glycogen-binding domain-containing protein [Elusimicrobiota bacterium]